MFQYAGAEYKSFTTEQEALEYIGRLKNNDVQSESYAYVDGSFNIVTGVYGYGGFLVYNNENISLQEVAVIVKWLQCVM